MILYRSSPLLSKKEQETLFAKYIANYMHEIKNDENFIITSSLKKQVE